jgi:single-strand DNA-binding protein
MASLNLVQLMGNLTADPELRRIGSGTAVTELRLAVNESFTSKGGEKKEDVLYIDVTVWDKQAENCCQYLRKGSGVFVLGKLKMDTWDDKTTGEKRSKLKAQAERVQFLGGKNDDAPRSQGGNERRAEAPASRSAAPAPAGRGGGYSGQGGQGRAVPMTQAEADDDQIPFARPREFDVIDYFGGSVFEGEI